MTTYNISIYLYTKYSINDWEGININSKSIKLNKNIVISDEPKRLRINPESSLHPDKIPNLIPEKLLNDLQAGDVDPYYKVQEIDYSEPANGYYYQTSFFESYIKKLEKRPTPGSRDGHHIDPWGRPGNDVYLIGAKLDKKNKIAYFKNYFPLKGETGTIDQQAAFILAAKMNTVHFSLVSYTKDKIIRNEQGEIERIEVIESVKGERNDAVEYGMGAMKQKTNKPDPKEDGDNNKKSEKSKEVYIMPENEYQELLKNIKNNLDNGNISVKDLAKDLNLDLVTEKHRNAIAAVEAIEKITGSTEIEKAVQNMVNGQENVKMENFSILREKLMLEEFGPSSTEEKPNLKRDAAEPHVTTKICDEKALKEQIEKAKENSVVKMLAAQEADETSKINNLSGIVGAIGGGKYRNEVIKA